MNDLESIITNKRVALVCPSPHLQGENLGELIDSYDVICRVNEIFSCMGMEEDYGSRTDVCFWNLGCNFMNAFKTMIDNSYGKFDNVKLVVCPRHSLHVTPHHIGNFSPNKNVFANFKSLNIDKKFFHIGDDKNNEFESSIGCHPSLGTLALLTMLEYNVKELYVCGMSFYTTKIRYNDAQISYLKKHNLPVRHSYQPASHNSMKEMQYIRKIALNYPNLMGDDYFNKLIFE